MTLTEFLQARIAEDEKAGARAEWDDGGMCQWMDGWHQTPEQVEAECEAKRRIVELHECIDDRDAYPHVPLYCNPCQTVDGYGCEAIGDRGVWPCGTMKALAAIYADHPDFREEWAP